MTSRGEEKEVAVVDDRFSTARKLAVTIFHPKRSLRQDKATQSDFRESEAQTLPWRPEIVFRRRRNGAKTAPDGLFQGTGGAVSLEEAILMERARQRQAWEDSLPRVVSRRNKSVRLSCIAAIAINDRNFREAALDAENRERLRLSTEREKASRERLERKLQTRLENVRRDKSAENSKKTEHWRHRLRRDVRKLTVRCLRWRGELEEFSALGRVTGSHRPESQSRPGTELRFTAAGTDDGEGFSRHLAEFASIELLEKQLSTTSRSEYRVADATRKNVCSKAIRKAKEELETVVGKGKPLSPEQEEESRRPRKSWRKKRFDGEEELERQRETSGNEDMYQASLLLCKIIKGRAVHTRIFSALAEMQKARTRRLADSSPLSVSTAASDCPLPKGLRKDPYGPDARHFSAGYRAAPTKAANNKGVSSFVILGEMLNTPVQSRPPSPSGRVSPFRGHAFKSPVTSRSGSPAPPKPKSKPVAATTPSKPAGITPAKLATTPAAKGPRVKTDIGLPPKSPKRIKLRQANMKLGLVQKTNLGVETKSKPSRTPRPGRKQLNVAKKGEKAEPAKKEPETKEEPKEKKNEEIVLMFDKKLTDMREVSEALLNLTSGNVDEVKTDTTEESGESTEKKDSVVEEKKDGEEEKEEAKEVVKEVEEEKEEANTDRTVALIMPSPDYGSMATEANKAAAESERLVPCLQPDKCHIAPPTMASPSPIVTSAINAPSQTTGSALTKTTESVDTSQVTTTRSLNAVSSTVALTGNLSKRSHANATAETDPAKAPEPSEQQPTSTEMPPEASLQKEPSITSVQKEPTTPVQKESTGSVHGDIVSTSNLIKVDSELELLSANNLRDSPPRQPNPAWNEERLVNGDVPSEGSSPGKFRRFLSSLWNVIKYLLCCRCILDRCRKSNPCQRSKCCQRSNSCSGSNCCRRPTRCRGSGSEEPETLPSSCCCCCPPFCSRFFGFFGRSDRCCGKCKKVKCCEGTRCCRKRSEPPGPRPPKRNRCAKMNCSCRDCCAKMKNCCLNCGNNANNFCRGLFCLNLMCCQKCLRKCCKPCHKLKCCQMGGCCSCFNPSVRRSNPKLDKRASTQSKAEKENLDPVLVEHVSLMKAAIPVLPITLAVLCLLLNLVIPGSGTLLSGLFCLCFGKPRFSIKDSAKNRIGSFCVNLIIGIAQLFTIIFCLVGWGWSIWWGVIMYRLARKQRRIKMAAKTAQEANDSANQNHVDVEKG